MAILGCYPRLILTRFTLICVLFSCANVFALASLKNVHRDVANIERSGIPIVLIITSSTCHVCEQLKREIFEPMALNSDYDTRMTVRELMLDSSENIIGFDGQPVSAAQLAGRYDATLTPSVLFLGAGGREVAKRLIGISNIDYYGWYLDKSLARASKQIRDNRRTVLTLGKTAKAQHTQPQIQAN
jgi:thioredoxin-related protein